MMFDYTVKAHPTQYGGVMFRSRLEARWAAFFDLCRWRWKYEPIDLEGWTPDFYVKFPCCHSECARYNIEGLRRNPKSYEYLGPGFHELYVEVKPAHSLYQLERAVSDVIRGMDRYNNPSPAMFGIDPSVTDWEMCHGAGGGMENVPRWVDNWEKLWIKAGNITQWKPA